MKYLKICAEIDAETQNSLDALPEGDRSAAWNDKQNRHVQRFKRIVASHAALVQEGRCAWCNLLTGVDVRRSPERDHIAPKARYPRWTFVAQNVLMACESCNGPRIKGQRDPVEIAADEYESTTFLIVHPYRDDPADHLVYNGPALLFVTGLTPKGIAKIDFFKLDSPALAIVRAMEFLAPSKDLSTEDQARLIEAMAGIKSEF